MVFISEPLAPFLDWLGQTTLQASILIILILVIQLFLRPKLGAGWHHGLWLILLVRMIMPWAPESSLSLFNLLPQTSQHRQVESAAASMTEETGDSLSTITATTPPYPSVLDTTDTIGENINNPANRTAIEQSPQYAAFRIADLWPVIWLAGVLILAGYIGVANFILWRIVKHERPLTDRKILDLMEDCKSQMRIRAPLTIIPTNKVSSPALFGFIRPRLLLPEGLTETLSLEQMRYIFLHELAHLKRHDILLGWLTSLLQALHWFNPLIWLAFHRMRADRELACDALALSYTTEGEAPRYGRTIVNLLERFSRPQYLPGMAGILENKSQLKRRITMIAGFKKRPRHWSTGAAILITLLSWMTLTNANSQTPANTSEQPAGVESASSATDMDKAEGETSRDESASKLTAKDNVQMAQVEKLLNEADAQVHQISEACERENWTSVDLTAKSLRDIFRHFQEGIQANYKLEHAKELDMDPDAKESWESSSPRKLILALESRVSNEIDVSELRRLINDITEYADDLHDAVRDNKTFLVSAYNQKIREEWARLKAICNYSGRSDQGDDIFVNDPQVIGQWEVVDSVLRIEDFDPQKPHPPNKNLFLKGLIFYENGRMPWAWKGWSKGKLYHWESGVNEYSIKVIDGQTYMFLHFAVGSYVKAYYVLRKLPAGTEKFRYAADLYNMGEKAVLGPDSKIDENGRIIDKIDYPFVDDPQVIGQWKSVDFVAYIEDFNPKSQHSKGDLFLKELTFLKNGRTARSWWTWTKGMVFHSGDMTASKYHLKTIDGDTFMFYEWKSGDYCFGHAKPSYYVLKKVSTETGELGRSWDNQPSDQEFRRQLPAKVAQLDINKATLDDVIRIFGEPAQYAWGNDTFTKDKLPDRYIACYPDQFSIFMKDGKIIELRFESPGYKFMDKLQVGDSLEKTLSVLGAPVKTVTNQKNTFEDGVLFKDIESQKGRCYYARSDQSVRMFFSDNKICALYVTRTEPQ